METLQYLKNLDETTRQLVGLYAAEKSRADALAQDRKISEEISISAVGCDVAQAQIIGLTKTIWSMAEALRVANIELERYQELLAHTPDIKMGTKTKGQKNESKQRD